MPPETKTRSNLAARIYRRLAGARGLDDHERWQHALFFAMSPQERCHFSLKTARSALSLRRSTKQKDRAVLPILERTLRLAKRLQKRRPRPSKARSIKKARKHFRHADIPL
ncbi:MAG: hypothetical protein L0Z50_27405 [Verrucomicrobiales bacterium]|nr:hypothetical protein [Verrucomicrobiales bacterium]